MPRPKRVPRALPPPVVEPSRSSAEKAARYIKRMIFEGHLPVASRVPQDDVADALQLSRLPVREACLMLEREGWVTVLPKRGSYVASFTPQWLRDHYELLGLTYGLAARRAVQNDGASVGCHLDAIEKALRATTEPHEVRRHADAFQAAVVEHSQSQRITSVLRSMTPIVQGNFFVEVPGAVETMKRGARAITRAVKNGDGETAADAYLKMLRIQGEMVVRLFAERALFGSPATRSTPARQA